MRMSPRSPYPFVVTEPGMRPTYWLFASMNGFHADGCRIGGPPEVAPMQGGRSSPTRWLTWTLGGPGC